VEPGIGLSLSGGGFRATLFHSGSLWRLAELGALPHLKRISSVSGGSIFLGALACEWQNVVTAPSAVSAYKDRVVAPVRAFCGKTIDAIAFAEGAFGIGGSAADALERQYSDLMPLSLNQLPDNPLFVFNATNLQTGRDFRFTKPYMGDYRLGLIRNPYTPVAKAAAASSAFPPFLSPLILRSPGTFEAVPGADLNGNHDYTDKIILADGGVYDNLALETVWKRCQTVLVSDAGGPFSLSASVKTDVVSQPLRTLDIALDQALSLRKRFLVEAFQQQERSGTYWGIATKITDYNVADGLPCDVQIVGPIASMRTRLDPFSEVEQCLLINWGYALCDAAVRRYAPQIITTPAVPAWPYPAHPLS
jgi:NTE family protein